VISAEKHRWQIFGSITGMTLPQGINARKMLLRCHSALKRKKRIIAQNLENRAFV